MNHHETSSETSSNSSTTPSETPSTILASPHTLVGNNSFSMARNDEIQPRTLNDYLHPTRTSMPSCIIFPPNMPALDFKPAMIQLLPTFHGMENESPYVHIRESRR